MDAAHPLRRALPPRRMHGPSSAPFKPKGCSCPALSRMGRIRAPGVGDAHLSDAHAGPHQSRLRGDVRLRTPRAADAPGRSAPSAGRIGCLEEEWEIVVSGVYPAYLTEEQYARNREQLRANMYNFIHRRPGAPREGTALLQGLVLCGRCGRRMQVQYSQKGPRYVCREAAVRYATATCQSFGQRYLDEAVRAVLL